MTLPDTLRKVLAHPLEYYDFASLKNGGAEHGILDPHDFTPARREAVAAPPGAPLVELEIGFANAEAEAQAAERERGAAAPRDLARAPGRPVPAGVAVELLGRIARAVKGGPTAPPGAPADLTGGSAVPPTAATAPGPPTTAADPRPNRPATLGVSPVLPGRRIAAGMKADQVRRDTAAAPRSDTEDLYAEYVKRFEQRPPRRPGW